MTEPETTCKGFEVNHLVKQYANADKPVLDDISFKVEHGSVLVVLADLDDLDHTEQHGQ